MLETLVGKVTRYDASGVAVLKLDRPLYVDDWIHIRGHRTDLEQLVEALRMDDRGVPAAYPGKEVEIRVSSAVSAGDKVFRETYCDEDV